MTGTWINMAAIVAGAVLGMLAKKGIPHRVEESLTRIQGLAVGLIGLNGVIASMFTVDADGGISVKSTLDFVTCLVLASSLGIGVAFAAVPTLIYQGAITLCAGFLAPYISDDLLNMICMVGYAIVICIGLNLLMNAKIKTANLLPAMIVPVLNNLLNMLKIL